MICIQISKFYKVVYIEECIYKTFALRSWSIFICTIILYIFFSFVMNSYTYAGRFVWVCVCSLFTLNTSNLFCSIFVPRQQNQSNVSHARCAHVMIQYAYFEFRFFDVSIYQCSSKRSHTYPRPFRCIYNKSAHTYIIQYTHIIFY